MTSPKGLNISSFYARILTTSACMLAIRYCCFVWLDFQSASLVLLCTSFLLTLKHIILYHGLSGANETTKWFVLNLSDLVLHHFGYMAIQLLFLVFDHATPVNSNLFHGRYESSQTDNTLCAWICVCVCVYVCWRQGREVLTIILDKDTLSFGRSEIWLYVIFELLEIVVMLGIQKNRYRRPEVLHLSLYLTPCSKSVEHSWPRAVY